ncbi:MAG: Rieske 2Fe-2S domain-containing protein [Oscillochloris sp.]|nr:Rieske 2Fe-2S domain-containing protein [Oscillochloris sp.]
MTLQNRTETAGTQEIFPQIEARIDAIPGYKEASQQIADTIHSAVLDGGPAARNAADLLHGTWLGHPLHPVLTDIPIGSWTLAALFDGLEAVTGNHYAGRVADTLIGVGAAAAVPTALAGIADYSAIKQDSTSLAAAHGALNSVGLGLYLLSLNERRRGRRGRGRLFGALAFGLVTLSAGMGGDLVYRKRVGVNHAPEPAGPTEWIDALSLNELQIGAARRVDVEGEAVLLYRPDANLVRAISAICNHAGGPLEEGNFKNGCVECPWHQSVFDLSDGHAVHGPATMPQPTYATRVRNGQIQVQLGRGAEYFESLGNVRTRTIGE